MDCQTLKKGTHCAIAKEGCQLCSEVVEQCETNEGKSCENIIKNEETGKKYCIAYIDPSLKWKNGKCNLGTNCRVMEQEEKDKTNPLKASKQKARGKK